jgi:hypothetical protein
MSDSQSQIVENLRAVQNSIAKEAAACGRDVADINLVAVSKKQPVERVQAMLDCGHRLFGENRVQDAMATWENLRPQYDDLKLHLIGPLQTNKVREAVSLFDVIETIDRPKLASALAAEMQKQGRKIPCFIQVNTGEEAQKSGVLPHDLPSLLQVCRDEGLEITGLMCIPPLEEPAALHFAFLKKLAEENNLPHLSMGMSGDFEKAIALGATYIRVGTALFGNRQQ